MTMNWTTGLVVLLAVTAAATSDDVGVENCKPFGVRLALGESAVLQSSEEVLSIWFNTPEPCSASFTYVEKGSSISKIYCPGTPIKISTYTSYSHKCSINTDKLKHGDYFEYLVYGASAVGGPAFPSHNHNLKSHLPSKNQDLKIVVLADWSTIDKKKGIYDSLDSIFDYLLKKDEVDLLYVNGDIAYDLSSNAGHNYEEFIAMMSQVSVRWPTIMTTGNHERNTPTDTDVFEKSFQIFNMTKTNLTTIDLGTHNLLVFDPFEIVLNKSKTNYLFPRFEEEIVRLEAEGKPIIVSSHYPLACSGSSVHCKNERYLLHEFFQSMIDHHSVFYLGSHYHTYERLYPFVGDGNFDISNKGPYYLSKTTKYLLSVLEGISGNDQKIVESYKSIEPFTANLSYNKTGVGMLSLTPTSLIYEHFLATDPVEPVDSLQVDYSRLFGEGAHIRSE